jgi:cytochrome c oxidase assembly protein subunit 15
MSSSLLDRRLPVGRLAVWALLFNLGIILWGALVRATGSGAGCGAHWPACNGEILPSFDSIHRLIEFTHRLSVAIGIVVVGWLWVRVRRGFPSGHPARSAASFTLIFTVSESLIGAGLVLFKLVAQDASVYRAVAVSAHLVNTFLLLASLTLTVWWVGNRPRIRISGQGLVAWLVGAALVGAVIVGVTGAVNALGETLFPALSRDEIGRQVSANAHFLKQLRVYHPMAAIAVGMLSLAASWLAAALRPSAQTRGAAYWVTILVVAQIGAGFVNLLLLAPLAMQLTHLLLADALWIGLVLLAASALSEGAPRAMRLRADHLRVGSTS